MRRGRVDRDVGCELVWWIVQAVGVAAAGAEREERAPVDGHGQPGAQERDRLGRLGGIHVSGAQRRSPALDRHEGGVQGLGQVRHAREDLSVAREVDAATAFDDEADGSAPHCDRWAPRGVDGRDGPDGDVADPHLLSGCQLDHRPAETPQLARGAGGGDDGRAGVKPPQRGDVKGVAMRVRDQHRVERAGVGRLRRPRP